MKTKTIEWKSVTRLATFIRFIVLFSGSVIFVACAPGSGEGLDENGRPFGEDGGPIPLIPELASIQSNVFTPSCATSGCHVGATAPLGLRLDATSSHSLLVGVPSAQAPTVLRVSAGNPDDSYLIQKLEGTAAFGGRMPLTGPPFLDQATVDVIRQWISDGAPSASSITTQKSQVVSIDPADAADLNQLPANITVIFSQDMDGALLSDFTVVLTRSGSDGTFNDGNEVVVQPAGIALDPANLRRAIIDLTGVTAVADAYEIRLVATGATALASINGLVIDGDGEGGDFVSVFTVANSANADPIQAAGD